MIVEVRITQSFKKAVKSLLKKYPSLSQDLLNLQETQYTELRWGTMLIKSDLKFPVKEKEKVEAQGLFHLLKLL